MKQKDFLLQGRQQDHVRALQAHYSIRLQNGKTLVPALSDIMALVNAQERAKRKLNPARAFMVDKDGNLPLPKE